MIPSAHFFTDHPMATLVASILCEQVGLPVPSVPALLLIGSLAGLESANLTASICVAVVTCLVGDSVWFQIGRRRVSRNRPVSDASTHSAFWTGRLAEAVRRHQLPALTLARFLPGPNLAATFVGSSRMSRMRFFVLDAIASAIWAGGYMAGGYFYRAQLAGVISAVSAWSSTYLLLLVSSVVAIVLGIRLGTHNSSSCHRSRSDNKNRLVSEYVRATWRKPSSIAPPQHGRLPLVG